MMFRLQFSNFVSAFLAVSNTIQLGKCKRKGHHVTIFNESESVPCVTGCKHSLVWTCAIFGYLFSTEPRFMGMISNDS